MESWGTVCTLTGGHWPRGLGRQNAKEWAALKGLS